MEEMQVSELMATVERLGVAAVALEALVETMTQRQVAFAASAEESVGRIVATVESAREAELERKLADAERTIEELRASTAATAATGRKTLVAASVVAKGEGLSELAAVDVALASLSVEQRIAVKAEMLRAGLLR